MLNLKDAYEVLGIRENATRDEIMKRYNTLLKKYRITKLNSPDGTAADNGTDMEKVNMAYNLLMGYETASPLPNTSKASNFLYYYKFHIIIGIVVLIVAFFTVKGFVTRVDPDLNVSFIGEYTFSETDGLKHKLLGKLNGVKEIAIDVIPIFENSKSQQDYAFQMKALTVMAAGDIDVLILDKASFLKYGRQGAFASLDSLASEAGIDRTVNKDFIFKAEGGQDEHLYGVDVGACKLLKESGVNGKEYIAAISIKSKHNEKAVNLVKLLTSASSE